MGPAGKARKWAPQLGSSVILFEESSILLVAFSTESVPGQALPRGKESRGKNSPGHRVSNSETYLGSSVSGSLGRCRKARFPKPTVFATDLTQDAKKKQGHARTEIIKEHKCVKYPGPAQSSTASVHVFDCTFAAVCTYI